RVLHRRHDHAWAGAAGEESIAVGGRKSPAHDAYSLPLRHADAHSACGAPLGRDDACRGHARGEKVRIMSAERLGLTLSRRGFLAAGGALVVGFSLSPASRLLAQAPPAAGPPGSLGKQPMLDAWIRIDADGGVT